MSSLPMRKLTEITDILKNKDFTTKIRIYMSSKTASEDYDNYENNYSYTNQNPITIKAYVRDLLPETAFWKQYGLHMSGIKEIITEDRFIEAFENCNKMEIDNIEYEVFKSGTGNNVSITKRPFKMLRVIVSRKT